ncbi:MAG: hypothetical protein HOC74_08900 [Gemmatimonadetes bacterium]|jgi:hypothetical protein|nr:hypothetical protein [Gemmatimonadota bacterium]
MMKRLIFSAIIVVLVMLVGGIFQDVFAQSSSVFKIGGNRLRPPQLDGVKGGREWYRVAILDCSPQSAGLTANQLGNSALEADGEAKTDADVSASIRLRWDRYALYFIAEVRDNMHDVIGTGEAVNWWERDGISFYIDLVDADDTGRPYTALNIINFMAAPQNSSAETITLTYTDSQGERVPTQDANDIDGLEYGYRDAGTEFGGSADYVIEGKIPWETLLRFNLTKAPSVDTVMGLSLIILDPDGDDGFGGQLQCWGMADNPNTYSDIVFRGLTISATMAGGLRGGRSLGKPIVPDIDSWGTVKMQVGEGIEE